jgi:hypothetical protein
VDAYVNARERDEHGQDEERRHRVPDEQREHDRPREAGRRVPRREGGADDGFEERVGLGQALVRARAPDSRFHGESREVRGPNAGGGQRRRRQERTARPHRERGCERDPDEPRVADDREADEDGIEPAGAMLDDPEEQLAIERRR